MCDFDTAFKRFQAACHQARQKGKKNEVMAAAIAEAVAYHARDSKPKSSRKSKRERQADPSLDDAHEKGKPPAKKTKVRPASSTSAAKTQQPSQLTVSKNARSGHGPATPDTKAPSKKTAARSGRGVTTPGIKVPSKKPATAGGKAQKQRQQRGSTTPAADRQATVSSSYTVPPGDSKGQGTCFSFCVLCLMAVIPARRRCSAIGALRVQTTPRQPVDPVCVKDRHRNGRDLPVAADPAAWQPSLHQHPPQGHRWRVTG